MLYFNLKSVFAARQIDKPYSFLVKLGISSITAHKIINNDTHVMRLDNLEMICKALYCSPDDLLAYRPDKNNPIPKTHPLHKLIPIEDNNDWQKQLKTMPLSKLKQISNILNKEDTTGA